MSTFAPSHIAARTFELDLRDRPHSERHSVVFARLDDLGPEDRMIVVCQDSGPPASRVQITRR